MWHEPSPHQLYNNVHALRTLTDGLTATTSIRHGASAAEMDMCVSAGCEKTGDQDFVGGAGHDGLSWQ